MRGLGLKRVGAALPSVSYHPLSHMLGDKRTGSISLGFFFSDFGFVFQSERTKEPPSSINTKPRMSSLSTHWVFLFFYCPSCSATSSRSLSDLKLHLLYSSGPTNIAPDIVRKHFILHISFSQLESNITEDKGHNSGFSVTLTTRHNSRHLLFAKWLPDLILLLMAPCCLQVKI